MLIVMIVITVLALLVFIYIRDEGIEHQKRQAERIRELLIINEAHNKFTKFLLDALSDDSGDQALKYKILKYLREDKIDLNPDGGK